VAAYNYHRPTIPLPDPEEARVKEACRTITRWQAKHVKASPFAGPPTLPMPLANGPLPGGLFVWEGKCEDFSRALYQFRLLEATWSGAPVPSLDLCEQVYGEIDEVRPPLGRLRTLAFDLSHRLQYRCYAPFVVRWERPEHYRLCRLSAQNR
jgi:hypothetical protein